MSFESVALVKKWGQNWLTMDGRDWRIGYVSGSYILEQLCFKRRKMTDCHTALDSLLLTLEPRRLHFKQGLG